MGTTTEPNINERTVKLHRTAITTKLEVRSVAELTRLVQAAGAFEEQGQSRSAAQSRQVPMRTEAGLNRPFWQTKARWPQRVVDLASALRREFEARGEFCVNQSCMVVQSYARVATGVLLKLATPQSGPELTVLHTARDLNCGRSRGRRPASTHASGRPGRTSSRNGPASRCTSTRRVASGSSCRLMVPLPRCDEFGL